jgi:hypothetical protein
MAAQTDEELKAAATAIRNETLQKANTHERIGSILENLVDNKVNKKTQYILFTDPDTNLRFRNGIRGSNFVMDKELTALGFAGVEGTDWENIAGAL